MPYMFWFHAGTRLPQVNYDVVDNVQPMQESMTQPTETSPNCSLCSGGMQRMILAPKSSVKLNNAAAFCHRCTATEQMEQPVQKLTLGLGWA